MNPACTHRRFTVTHTNHFTSKKQRGGGGEYQGHCEGRLLPLGQYCTYNPSSNATSIRCKQHAGEAACDHDNRAKTKAALFGASITWPLPWHTFRPASLVVICIKCQQSDWELCSTTRKQPETMLITPTSEMRTSPATDSVFPDKTMTFLCVFRSRWALNHNVVWRRNRRPFLPNRCGISSLCSTHLYSSLDCTLTTKLTSLASEHVLNKSIFVLLIEILS